MRRVRGEIWTFRRIWRYGEALEDQKEALIWELERMKKTLQKNGLSSKIEMNQEMKNLLRVRNISFY